MIFAFLARLGVPQRFQALALGLGAVAILALCVGLWLHFHDRAVIRDHEAKREASAAVAREKAAEERTADAIVNTRNEEDLHHAIDTAPKGGEISPAAHALACERLRKLGRVPAACRPAGSH
jgi:D-arabinose 1-dehydrogenase-like Zn-dependent alcohol dehydrogenase